MATANSSALPANRSNGGLVGPETTPSTFAPYTSPHNINYEPGNEQYFFPQDAGKYYMMLMIQDYKRNNLLRVSLGSNLKYLRLPMPTNMADTHRVAYEQTPVGFLTGSFIQGGPMGLSGAEDFLALKGLSGLVSGGLRNSRFGAFAQSLGMSENPMAAYSALTGKSPNQFMTILLKGPEYKVHNFTWRLFPENKNESDQIKKIVALLNNSMAPTYADGIVSFFGFPKVFSISFRPNENMLYKFNHFCLF